MRLKATRMSQSRRVPLANLLRNSGIIKFSPWSVGGNAGTVSERSFTFGANALSQVEQNTSPNGGTASKTFTAAAVISCPSGTVQFRLKNTHGMVVDNFSANLTATTTPTLFVYTVTNANSPGNGWQIFGVANSTAGAGGGVVTVHSTLMIEGSFTAQQIIDRGGIHLTY